MRIACSTMPPMVSETRQLLEINLYFLHVAHTCLGEMLHIPKVSRLCCHAEAWIESG